jgi:hypothetical protein
MKAIAYFLSIIRSEKSLRRTSPVLGFKKVEASRKHRREFTRRDLPWLVRRQARRAVQPSKCPSFP